MKENNYLEWINEVGVLNIPNTITEIPENIFRNNQIIKAIRCANSSSLKSIGDYAFANCVNVTTIDFPKSLQTIGKNAFAGCSSLQSIVIPKRIKMIDACAFKDCIKLADVKLEVIKKRDYALMLSENEQSNQKFDKKLLLIHPVKIRKTLAQSTIGDCAFQNCQSLTSVYIPNHFKKIGGICFCWM